MDVIKIETPAKHVRLKVAAYARVSTDHDRQQASITQQISTYAHLIATNPAWQYAGVYVDDGITGTSTVARAGFNDLMDLARRGGVEVILTKSISRFARNTVDLLASVRELKTLGVAVRFEREGIDTLTGDGELLLTLLASFAQAESESNSQAVAWAIRKKFERGIPHSRQPYGYIYNNGHLLVNRAEAEVVQRVYAEFLAGISPEETARRLTVQGVHSRRSSRISASMLRRMLENPIYTGNLMLQATYRPRISNRNVAKNTGELDQYWVQDNHEPIIDQDTFDQVQTELALRRHYGRAVTPTGGSNALTSLIQCSECGRNYHRRTKTRRTQTYKFWWCWTATRGSGNPCHAPQLRETKLQHACQHALGLSTWDEGAILEGIEKIIAHPDRTLVIHLTDSHLVRADLDQRQQHEAGKEQP